MLLKKKSVNYEEEYKCIEETKNYWITKMKALNPESIIAYRFMTIKNKKGIPHRLLFALTNDLKWHLYAIYHPKKYESLEYVEKYENKCLS